MERHIYQMQSHLDVLLAAEKDDQQERIIHSCWSEALRRSGNYWYAKLREPAPEMTADVRVCSDIVFTRLHEVGPTRLLAPYQGTEIESYEAGEIFLSNGQKLCTNRAFAPVGYAVNGQTRILLTDPYFEHLLREPDWYPYEQVFLDELWAKKQATIIQPRPNLVAYLFAQRYELQSWRGDYGWAVQATAQPTLTAIMRDIDPSLEAKLTDRDREFLTLSSFSVKAPSFLFFAVAHQKGYVYKKGHDKMYYFVKGLR